MRSLEQKQLDETENSYTGEEFIDDADLADDIVIEEVKPKAKPGRKVAKKSIKHQEPEPKHEDYIDLTSAEGRSADKSVLQGKSSHQREQTPAAGHTPPLNPWSNEQKSEGMLAKASTWKAIAGIAVILLLLSVFTQGFGFSGKNAGTVVPLPEAENKALAFVNTNLLRPPFAATVANSAEEGSLYRITLSVAGQMVDSYITKDGKKFFPQGFNTDLPLEAELSTAEVAPTPAPEPAADDVAAEEAEQESEPVVGDGGAGEANQESGPAEAAPPEEASSEETPIVAEEAPTQFTITAKKWLFTPTRITVKKDSTITFIIEPQELDFTFSLPAFNVEQQVSGTTTVSFTAAKAGEFPFSCSSCEEFRGMSGTLVVE